MILVLKAIILGIVEGFTEFLPISSTGHLILVNQFISFDEQFTTVFDIVIQLGAILAVLIYFRKKLWPFGSSNSNTKEVILLWQKTIIGVLPAIFFGVLFGNVIEKKLFNPWIVALALFIGGIIIIIIEKKKRLPVTSSIDHLSIKTAFFIGLIQCLSFIPGTSRSGATIMGGVLLGASRTVATEFSFFLAIPTMFAASLYSLIKYRGSFSLDQYFLLSVGFIVSFIVAFFVIKFFIRYIQKSDFTKFGYYRVILAILIIIFLLVT